MRRVNSIPVKTRLAASAAAGQDIAAFRRALLRWYDHHRRDLPWRKTRDPYRIWLSEIMLQQTRVAAVLEHYRLFLERFPHVQALAAASEDDVLAAWSGLGYYRRARLLHQCAKDLVENHGGRFPQTADALQALPGIGRYTAAAIASITFGEAVAVVDGNVERVLQRLMGAGKSGTHLTSRHIWERAQALLNDSRPGDFNQAMMELGATVCVPREPRCPVCPIRKWCVTQQSSQAPTRAITMELRSSAPGKAPSRSSARQVKKEIWCVLGQRSGGIRLVQRPKKASLMPGMWELPQTSKPPRQLPVSAHWRTFRHSITVTDYTVHVVRSTVLQGALLTDAKLAAKSNPKGKWVSINRLPEIPITGLTRKILKAGGII